jgi:RNA polymerase sigma factor (sigma-70 family)
MMRRITQKMGVMVELTGDEVLEGKATADPLTAHGPMLLAVARVITRDDEEAADLVQTTFEIALRHLDELRDPAAMPAWLMRIETREAFRVVRRLRRLVRFNVQERDLSAQPTDLAQHADVHQALANLPARTRAAVALHHLVGLSVRETADALGVSENTVKSQLKSGFARLREALRHD